MKRVFDTSAAWSPFILRVMLGVLTRVGAFGILCNMLGAIALVHWSNGLCMNWLGRIAQGKRAEPASAARGGGWQRVSEAARQAARARM